MQLHTPSQARQEIRGKLRTGNWWLLIPVGEHGRDMCRYIEARYYSGKKNADFHLHLGRHPEHGMAAVFLGAKKHLPIETLYTDAPGRSSTEFLPIEHLETRNVILLASADDELAKATVLAEATKAMLVFGLEVKDL